MVPNIGYGCNQSVDSSFVERLRHLRLRNTLEPTIIPQQQLGFRGHSTTQQTHRIVNKIIKSLEEKTL
jgi:hypothetical protein